MATQQSIQRRMNWTWFLLTYCLFMTIATSVTTCFVTAIISLSESDVYNELNPNKHLIEFCRTHKAGVDCDRLDEKMRQDHAIEQAEEEIPTWMIVAFYFMASQVMGAACYGLWASSGRLRDLRIELKALKELDKFGGDGDGEDAHMLSERNRSMDEPDDRRDIVPGKGGV